MEMSIASLPMSMKTASLANDVSMSVLNMAMDSATSKSASMIDMIESCDPNLGNNIDAVV